MYGTAILTSDVIIKRIKADLRNPPNKVEGSLGADNAHAVGKEFGRYYAYVNWLQDMHYVETAEGEFLDKKAHEAGVYRKEATSATGTIRFYGVDGTFIPQGTIVRSETQSFQTKVAATILTEYVDVEIEAVEPGEYGNLPPFSISNFDPIQGVKTIENVDPTIGGTETESDERFRERTLLRMRYPGTSGNKYHYMHWAMEVNGVGRVKVFSEWAGPGTVKVSILDANQRIASQDLQDKVKMHIDPGDGDGEALAPIGATLTVSTATAIPLNIKAHIVPVEENISMSGVVEILNILLQEYLDEHAYTTERITVAKIIDILLSVEGVRDVIECTVNDISTSIHLGKEEIPVIGTVVVT